MESYITALQHRELLFFIHLSMAGAQGQLYYGTSTADRIKGLAQGSNSGSSAVLNLWSVMQSFNHWETTATNREISRELAAKMLVFLLLLFLHLLNVFVFDIKHVFACRLRSLVICICYLRNDTLLLVLANGNARQICIFNTAL